MLLIKNILYDNEVNLLRNKLCLLSKARPESQPSQPQFSSQTLWLQWRVIAPHLSHSNSWELGKPSIVFQAELP